MARTRWTGVLTALIRQWVPDFLMQELTKQVDQPAVRENDHRKTAQDQEPDGEQPVDDPQAIAPAAQAPHFGVVHTQRSVLAGDDAAEAFVVLVQLELGI